MRLMGYETLVAVLLLTGCVLSQDGAAPKIWYGNDTQPGEFPFMVSLEWAEGSHHCGGSLIEPRVVLTAAHCIYDDQGEVPHPSGLKVHVGAWNLTDRNASSERMSVGRIISHPDYNGYTVANDIALVILNDPVNVTSGIASLIDLPQNDTYYAEGSAITVIGWGGTDDGATVADILQKHEYTISNQSACNETWAGKGYFILPGMLCTGEPPLDGHSWFGDSGGPLFTQVGGNFVLLALTSWGSEDPSNYTYDVNADVWYYNDWIMENLNQTNRPVRFELLGGKNESEHGIDGIVVYDDFGAYGTICRDYSMGVREVMALCRFFGFYNGIATDARQYVAKEKKGNYYWNFDMPEYAVSKMECHENATNITNGEHCHFDLYPHNSPCFDGEQLAIRCSDNPWHLNISRMDVSVTTMATGYVKGKVSCKVEAFKYAMGLDLKAEITVYLFDIAGEDSEYVKTLKWNKKQNAFITKLKTNDKAVRNCFVCYAELKDQDEFYTMQGEASCEADLYQASRMTREKVKSMNRNGGL